MFISIGVLNCYWTFSGLVFWIVWIWCFCFFSWLYLMMLMLFGHIFIDIWWLITVFRLAFQRILLCSGVCLSAGCAFQRVLPFSEFAFRRCVLFSEFCLSAGQVYCKVNFLWLFFFANLEEMLHSGHHSEKIQFACRKTDAEVPCGFSVWWFLIEYICWHFLDWFQLTLLTFIWTAAHVAHELS